MGVNIHAFVVGAEVVSIASRYKMCHNKKQKMHTGMFAEAHKGVLERV